LNESLSLKKNQLKTEKRTRREKTPITDSISYNNEIFNDKN
jgi:hypothetical protein